MSDKVESSVDPETGPVPAPQPAAARSIQGVRWVVVVLAILTSTFFYGLDNTVVADIQPTVVQRFNAIDRLSWISVTFLIGAAGTNFFWGQVYSLFNVKWTYIICVALFEVGSALCGAAPTMTAFLIGRTICGLGGCGMYTGVMVMLSFLTTPKERPAYLGLTGLTWGLGTVLGPIIGGVFALHASWRWGLYINLIFGAIAAPVYFLMIPSLPASQGPAFARWKKVDFLGMVLIIGLLLSCLMAINFGGVLYPWSSGRIIALFVVSGVLSIAFSLQQGLCIGTSTKHRSFPVHFLRNAQLLLLFAAEVCATTLTFTPIYFLPLYFQLVKSDSALTSGVKCFPLVVFLVVTIVGNGMATARYPWFQPWFILGSVTGTAGSVLLYTTSKSPHSSDATIYGASVLTGFGAGCFVTLCFAAAQTHVSERQADIPHAVAFMAFAQQGGAALTLAIANSVFVNDAVANIAGILPRLSRDAILRILSGVADEAIREGLSGVESERVAGAVAASLGRAYIVAIACGALAVVLSVGIMRDRGWEERVGRALVPRWVGRKGK
ncbi:major facilitator superfamily domain-containing protein [Aspergillus carlsbadensis]|nr:major facilitator superfamily domain-containing protein [Aspergillus carlsbadensis]